VIIDGGNTFYKDDIRRAAALRSAGVHYLDVGTSGGVWGLERGYCLMIGGEKAAFDRLEPIFEALAPEEARSRARRGRDGPRAQRARLRACRALRRRALRQDGSQRDRIWLMQAYAEGFDILNSRGSDRLPESRALRVRPGGNRRGLAARQRTCRPASRSCRLRSCGGCLAVKLQRRRPGFRRGGGRSKPPLRKPCPADVLASALFARVPLPAGPHVRRETPIRHAAQVWGHAERVGRVRRAPRARCHAEKGRTRSAATGMNHDIHDLHPHEQHLATRKERDAVRRGSPAGVE
jgi:hypothetical protein